MRSFLILGLAAGLLVGCQPSPEKQADRELAVEEIKNKKRQKSLNETSALSELSDIRVALMILPANESKVNLDILNDCELRYGNAGKADALSCYIANKK